MMSRDTLKKERTGFTMIPNALISDSNITGKAKAIYCYLFSRPDDWTFHVTEISNNFKEGRDAIYSAIGELISTGWINKTQVKDESGKFSHNEFEIFAYARPVSDEAVNGKPVNGEADTNNTDNTNIDITKTDDNKKTSKKELTVVSDEEPREVAYHLYEKILTVQPNAKLNPESWIKDIEKAIRLDGRTKYGLIACIDWIYHGGGDFWIPNIMSGNKLRHKYDQMEIQAKRTRQQKISETDKTIARLAAEGRL